MENGPILHTLIALEDFKVILGRDDTLILKPRGYYLDPPLKNQKGG
jgi:hypothetical protein